MHICAKTALITGIALLMGSASYLAQAQSNSATPAVPPPQGEEFEQAALDFLAWCGPCHGASGKGNGPIAPSLTISPPDLTMISKKAGGEYPAEQVRLQIDGRDLPAAHGSVEMPVWGYWFNLQATAAGLLQEEQAAAEKEVKERIARLVEYLRTLQN